jgi:hypothetical protein
MKYEINVLLSKETNRELSGLMLPLCQYVYNDALIGRMVDERIGKGSSHFLIDLLSQNLAEGAEENYEKYRGLFEASVCRIRI